MDVSGGNRLVAFARVVSGFCRDGPQPLFRWDLIEKLRQHESTAYIACRDLSSPNVKCFLIQVSQQINSALNGLTSAVPITVHTKQVIEI